MGGCIGAVGSGHGDSACEGNRRGLVVMVVKVVVVMTAKRRTMLVQASRQSF